GLFGDGHLQQRVLAGADAVDGIRPVDEQAAPHHQRQNRKIDPVKPPDRQRMFLLQRLHGFLDAAVETAVTSYATPGSHQPDLPGSSRLRYGLKSPSLWSACTSAN